MTPAILVLEDGRTFRGTSFGAVGSAFGEAVFTTGMTGYQETLTDPSYRRQVVVSTAPQIGNTGWATTGGPAGDQDDNESKRIWVAGYVVRDLSPVVSNWRSSSSLPAEMDRQGVVGIAGVDTRALTRHLRSAGAMRCGIFAGAAALDADGEGVAGTAVAGGSAAGGGVAGRGAAGGGAAAEVAAGQVAALVRQVRAQPGMDGADLTGEVSTAFRYTVPAQGKQRFTVAAIDLGIKANTPRMLAARGITTHVLPAGATIEEIEALGVDGVFLSNGPGDPSTQDQMIALTRAVLTRRIPLFGICFGNQILGRALGFGTYKLKFGHRGINQPVLERATGRVLISAHNHGFAVDAPLDGLSHTEFGRVQVGFTCLNDDVVEGLECLDVPAFSVQFHPEAAAGPHDAQSLFDRFATLMADPTQGAPATTSSPATTSGPATTAGLATAIEGADA